MTLWTWVGETARELQEAGHTEAAEAVTRMPQLAAEGDTERISAEMPSALRAVRGAAGPGWLEDYLSHWPIAARVGNRAEGTAALPSAESRLRTAHADDGAGCAPAACAAEGVLACQANIDGPGYADDRAGLLSEALGHVRPGEPAWESLVLERCHMLIDDERPDEAVRELDGRAAEVRGGDGGAGVSFEYGFGYLRALRHQDRHADALAAAERLAATAGQPPGAPGAVARRRLRFERARLLSWLARTGRHPPDGAEGARAALPEAQEAERTPFLRTAWVEAAENLIAVGAMDNDWRVGVRLTSWSRYSERVGAHRPCVVLSLAAARLAAARGARWTAAAAIRRAQGALDRIRRRDELAADLDEARADTERLTPVELPVPPGDLLALLREEPPDRVDPERQADLVVAALARRPDDPALLNALGQVGRTLMLTDSAADPHWRHVRQTPGDRKAAMSLLETLLHDNDMAGVRTLVHTLAEGASPAE